MKFKFLKKGVSVLALASMLCVMPAQSVLAAPAEVSLRYADPNYVERYGEDDNYKTLNKITKDAYLTLDGPLLDNPSLFKLNGMGSGVLTARFDKLPERSQVPDIDGWGLTNQAWFSVCATLDNGYTVNMNGGYLLVETEIYVNTDSSPKYGDSTIIYGEHGYIDAVYPFENCFYGFVDNGVTYDVGRTIDVLLAEFATSHADAAELFATHSVTDIEIFAGIKYNATISGVGKLFKASGLQSNTNVPAPVEAPQEPVAPVETPQEPVAPVETPQEPVAPVEIPQEPVAVPEVTTVAGDMVYTVKAGDTLGSISANYYGSNAKGGAIREQNKEVFVANKGKLVEGMQLVLPEKLGSKTRIAEPVANTGEALYTVMHGDTLCGIAKKIYGTEKKIADIFARNSDRLSDGSMLFPGQVIVLPAK